MKTGNTIPKIAGKCKKKLRREKPSPEGKAQIVEKLLGPLWEGAPPAGGGGESFTQARRFRAKARLSPSGPSGHLPPRGRFFDTQSFPHGGSHFNTGKYTLSLFQRHIRLRVADVLVGGADDAVRKLHFLHAVGAPAGHTGNGKQRGEQILADAQHSVNQPAE